MYTCSVDKTFSWRGKLTEKVTAVMRMFGLDTETLNVRAIRHKLDIELGPGQICYITGSSGSGKSVLLRQLYEFAPAGQRLWIDKIKLESDKSLIDCIEADVHESLRLLSRAGLSDAFAVLNQPANLSDGQKWRYRLARALISDKKIIFADEFCSTLDRITAAVISHNIRSVAAKSSKIFILAGSHEDILADLLPDVIVVKYLGGKTETIYRDRHRLQKKL